jgi:PAS domain S-box-containing protein
MSKAVGDRRSALAAGYESVRDVRKRLVETGLLWSGIAAPVGVALSLIRARIDGWVPIYYAHIVIGLILIAGAVFRRRLPYGVAVNLLLGVFFAVGLMGLLAFGLVGGGPYILAMFCIMSAIAFGTRGGLITCLIVWGSLIAAGVAVGSGVITFEFDIAQRAVSLSSWLMTSVGLLMFVSVTVLTLGVVHNHLVAALRESHEGRAKYERFLGNLVESFLYRHDTAGVFTYVSPSVTQVLGYSPEEFLTNCTTYLTDHPVNMEVQSHTDGSIKGIQQPPYDVQIFHKDGSMRWLEVSEAPVRDRDGRVIAVEGLAHEITERKHRESMTAAQLQLSALPSNLSASTLLQAVLDEAEELTGSQVGFYHFVDEDQASLQLQAWSTNTIQRMCKAKGVRTHYPIDKAGVWVDCIRQGKPVIHNDYKSLPHRKGLPEGHAPVIRELVVPIYRDDLAVAIIGVGNKPTDYVEADIDVVLNLGNLAWDMVSQKQAAEALEASEALLNDSQAIAHIGSWERDLAADRFAWSKETYRILGLSPENYVAAYETFLAVVHPEDRDRVDQAYRDSIRDGTDYYEIEHRIVQRSTGQIREVRQECRHLRNAAGKVVRSIGMIQDITERQRMTRAMSVLAEELAGLTGEALFQALVLRLAELLNVEYAAVGEWREEDPEQISTAAFASHREIVPNITYRLPGSPCENVIGKETCSYVDSVSEIFPADHMLSDVGARGYVGVPLFGPTHEPIGLLWIVDTRPITDVKFAISVMKSFGVRAAAELTRRRSQEALSESELRYRRLFETANDAIFLMEGQTFIDCNPRALEMYACSREELLNAKPYEFSPPTQPDGRNSQEKAEEKINAAIAGEGQFFEWEHCRADRSTFTAEVSLNSLELRGRLYLLAIVRDISKRKRAEAELARASELKSKFIKVAGHELRTPLSYILAMPSVVEGVADSGKLKDAINTMAKKARRLNDIVQSMFKLMPEGDYSEHLHLATVALSEILDRVQADCQPFVDERGQTLIIEQAEGIPPLCVDPYKIHDVIENLIGNAIKFGPEGGTIRVSARMEGAEMLRVAVADEGEGIPPEDLPDIFTPFYSIADVMKHTSGSIGKTKYGMGLGLTVVKHFVEMHGGTVDVVSSESGSTFSVILPVAPPSSSE